MSLKLMEFPNKDEKKAILETHSQGMESFNNFVNHLSYQPYNLNPDLTNTTVATYKKLSNLHNRTGRARFRRAPVPPPQLPPTSILPTYTPPPTSIPSTSTLPPALQIQNPQKSQNQSLTLDFTKPNIFRSNPKSLDLEFPKETFSVSSNSSFMSSAITGDLTGDNSVSNGKLGTSSLFLNPAVSGGKPPLSSASLKKSCHDHSGDVSGQGSGSNKCHCKKRKNRMKRIEKVPAISSKIADIPADQYSWRKYGQKPIKGSPFPRGYYRCSTSKQCPARKKVERSTEDPTMLIVTYEEEHRHHEIHGHSHTAMQGNISGNMGLFGGV